MRAGAVINIGSIASRLTIPTVGIYAGSKRALLALTDATRIEGKVFGIQAGYIELGNVATGLHERVVREAAERLVELNLSEADPLRGMMKRSEGLAMEVRKHALEPADAAERIWAVTEQKGVPRLTTIGRDAWRRRLVAACVPYRLIEWQLSRMINSTM